MKNVIKTLLIIYFAIGLVFGIRILKYQVDYPNDYNNCDTGEPVFVYNNINNTKTEMPQLTICKERGFQGIELKDIKNAGIWTLGWGYIYAQALFLDWMGVE